MTEEIIKLSLLVDDRNYVETLKSKHEVLLVLGESPDPAEVEVIQAFQDEMEEIEKETALEEALVVSAINTNRILAIAVGLLSLGTALCGISIIADQKSMWYAGIFFGTFGVICMGVGIFM